MTNIKRGGLHNTLTMLGLVIALANGCAAQTDGDQDVESTSSALNGFPSYPVHYSSPRDTIDGDYHFYMETEVTISSNGRIDWTTTVASTYWLRGFTGGQVIVLADAEDNVLWKSNPEQYGHGGTWVNGGPRMIPNNDQLPESVLQSAAKIAVVHYHDPHNRLAEDLIIGAKVAAVILPLLAAL